MLPSHLASVLAATGSPHRGAQVWSGILAFAGLLLAGPGSRLRVFRARWTEGAQVSFIMSGDEFTDDRDLKLRTWSRSSERTSYMGRRARCYVSAVGGVIVGVSGGLLLSAYLHAGGSEDATVSRFFGGTEIAVGTVIVVYSFMPYFAARSAYRKRIQATAAAEVDAAIRHACTGGRAALQLEDLFQLNRRQLDEYQVITRTQQRSAFRWAQIASVVALAVLVAGIVVALSVHDDVQKYVSGGLSGLGSTLSAFVANTFFQSAQDANKQMKLYYLEPQRTGRLLAAERIAREQLPAKDKALVEDMVTAVLSWEMPTDSDQAGQKTDTKKAKKTTPAKKAAATKPEG
jgi:hypothetical protein